MDMNTEQKFSSLPEVPPAIVQSAAQNTQDLSQAAFGQRTMSFSSTQEPPAITGIVKSSILNRWATDAGFLIGEGAVSQNLAAFNVGKLGAFIWNNIDLSDGGKVHEVDLGVNYTVSKKIGHSAINFNFGAQTWLYPSDLLSSKSPYDVIATATLSWSGPVTLSADYKHLFAGQSTEYPGELLVFKVAKEKQLKEFSNGSTLTLRVETQLPLRYNFFVKDGLSVPCVKPGVALRWTDAKHLWEIELSAKDQIGLSNGTRSQGIAGFSVQRAW